MNLRLNRLFLVLFSASVLGSGVLADTHRHRREQVVESQGSPQVEEAEQHIKKGEWSQAVPLLEQATAADPKNYLAWYDLGYVYSELGRTQESIAAYRKSVEAKPDIYESNLNLGLSLAQTGDPEAEKYLTAATGLTPAGHQQEGTYRAWLSLGHLLEDKHPSNAVAAFREASRLKPKDPEPHYSAGFVLQKSGDLSGAEHEFQAALSIDPKSSPSIKGLANVYMESKKLPEAETMLRKVLAEDPANATAHLQLGRVLSAQEKYKEASAEFDEGLKNAPGDFDLQREAAAVNAQAGDLASSEKRYRALVAAKPQNPELHQALARILKREHKYQESIEELRACLNLNPKAEGAYVDLAFTAAAAQNYPLSQAVLDARAREFPENATIYFLRATNLDHMRDVKNAVVYYKKFLAEANGKYPDQEWEARHRLVTLEGKVKLPQGGGFGR